MCFPGAIKARYDKDNPSTWVHWQTAEQKRSGDTGDPFASEDGRYDSLSGQTFDIQSQTGGIWENQLRYKGNSVAYAMEQIDKEWDHKAELEKIKSRTSHLASNPQPGRGFDRAQSPVRTAGSQGGGGGGMSTGDFIQRRGSK